MTPAPLILIVEDNEQNRKLVRDVLQASGYRTLESESAEEGLRLALEQVPDLVIMDYRLPGMDGITAMAALQNDVRTRKIPAVALTASAMPADRDRMMAAGFRAYRRKPIKVQELLSVVREVLDTV